MPRPLRWPLLLFPSSSTIPKALKSKKTKQHILLFNYTALLGVLMPYTYSYYLSYNPSLYKVLEKNTQYSKCIKASMPYNIFRINKVTYKFFILFLGLS